MDAQTTIHVDDILHHVRQLLRTVSGELERSVLIALLGSAERLVEIERDLREQPGITNQLYLLNSSITPIYGYAELIVNCLLGSLTADQQTHALAISRSARSLRAIVDGMTVAAG